MIDVSYLQKLYWHHEKATRVLHRSHITGWATYEDFPTFIEGFIEQARNPREPMGKDDAYGWCATLFMPTGKEEDGVIAHRAGEHAAEHLTLFVADLDNQHEDRTMIEIDAVEETLTALGLNHLLYTSFSNKPHRHKVRIVMPVTRPLTPDEAFEVFAWFNTAFDFQLDGSIYDPGDFLYGPPLHSDMRFSIDGDDLDVDAYRALSQALPDADRNFVKRHQSQSQTFRERTPEELANYQARLAQREPTGNVSIHNPDYFNPDWFGDLDSLYVNGSHWSTMLGLLTRVWLKAQCDLSRGDLEAIQNEIDLHWGGYMSRHYSSSELRRLVIDAMKQVTTPRTAPVKISDRLALKLMNGRMRHGNRQHQ